jgi:outer membrane protein TolC
VDVGFEIPIFRWGEGRAERQAAYANHESILNTVKIQEETFVQEVEYQVREFLLIQQQIQASAKADTIATRRFEVAKNRYLIGKIDITNLLIAQREKDDERQNYIQDLKQYWQGFYNLQRITLYDYENDQPMEFTYRFK